MPFEATVRGLSLVLGIALVSSVSLVGCATSATPGHGMPVSSLSSAEVGKNARFEATGQVSYYAAKFKGRRTASGERYNPDAFTAAHPTLPFGTLLLVKRKRTSRFVIVRVNDRGPHIKGRLLDLSSAAARRLGILTRGLATAEVYVINPRSSLASRL